MAEVTNTNGATVAGNGLGPVTHIIAVTDVSVVSTETVIAEATAGDANDNVYTVAAVEGVADGDHVALQGAEAAPSLTGATVVATFTQNP